MLIDLNADLGEGAGTDADLMPLITSANISCGFHAGDADTVVTALQLARQHWVSVGAHPGYPDRENFGRRELRLEEEQVHRMCIQQFGALGALCEVFTAPFRYIKPHGAFYHQACREEDYASGLLFALRNMAYDVDPRPVVGLPNSVLHKVADEHRHPFIPEGFADRRYRPDGTLGPRTEPDAILHDVKEVVAQVEWLVRTQGVRTICVHGDTPGAVEFVRAVRAALLDAGHELKAFV